MQALDAELPDVIVPEPKLAPDWAIPELTTEPEGLPLPPPVEPAVPASEP